MSGPAKPECAWLLRATLLLGLISQSLAAPGGHLVEGISDECDAINPIWSAGLRGFPEFLTVSADALSIRTLDNGDDPYPSAEDMISTYADRLGQSIPFSARPSVVAWVWLPPFSEWPSGVNAAGFREWFGIRVTAYDADLPSHNGYYYPGIYVSTDEAGPSLIARAGDGYGPDITIGRIPVAGWWTFGLAWNAEGRTEYYAAPGRLGLTSDDLLYLSPTSSDPAANRSLDQLIGNFVALRLTYPSTGQLSPDWRMDHFRVYVQASPALPMLTPTLHDGQLKIQITGCARGFRYLLQRSADLITWSTVADEISTGAPWDYGENASSGGFFRAARP